MHTVQKHGSYTSAKSRNRWKFKVEGPTGGMCTWAEIRQTPAKANELHTWAVAGNVVEGGDDPA
jgi:hypothetical protein